MPKMARLQRRRQGPCPLPATRLRCSVLCRSPATVPRSRSPRPILRHQQRRSQVQSGSCGRMIDAANERAAKGCRHRHRASLHGATRVPQRVTAGAVRDRDDDRLQEEESISPPSEGWTGASPQKSALLSPPRLPCSDVTRMKNAEVKVQSKTGLPNEAVPAKVTRAGVYTRGATDARVFKQYAGPAPRAEKSVVIPRVAPRTGSYIHCTPSPRSLPLCPPLPLTQSGVDPIF